MLGVSNFNIQTQYKFLAVLAVITLVLHLSDTNFNDQKIVALDTIVQGLKVLALGIIASLFLALRDNRRSSHTALMAGFFIMSVFLEGLSLRTRAGMPLLYAYPGQITDTSYYFGYFAKMLRMMAFFCIATSADQSISKKSFYTIIWAALLLVFPLFKLIKEFTPHFPLGQYVLGDLQLKYLLDYIFLLVVLITLISTILKLKKLIIIDRYKNQREIIFLHTIVVALSIAFLAGASTDGFHNLSSLDLLIEHILQLIVFAFMYRAVLNKEILSVFEDVEMLKSELKFRISNLKSLEGELESSRKLALVGTMVDSVTHDIGNLLMLMSASVDGIKHSSEIKEDGEVFTKADKIHKTIKKCKEYINRLLHFSHSNVSQVSSLNFENFINEFCNFIKPLVGDKITFQLQIKENLPLKISKEDLEQIILNLVINAKENFNKQPGLITIGSEQVDFKEPVQFLKHELSPGRYLMIFVEDNGTGIPDEIQSKIFEPFFSTKTDQIGAGVGLACVLNLVIKTGAFVKLESKQGLGSRFQIYFPVEERR